MHINVGDTADRNVGSLLTSMIPFKIRNASSQSISPSGVSHPKKKSSRETHESALTLNTIAYLDVVVSSKAPLV